MRIQRSICRRFALAFLGIGALAASVFAASSGAKGGQLGVPGSKLVPAINVLKNGKGVSRKTIKIVFNFPMKGCGTNASQVGTRLAAKQAFDDATVLVSWFNSHVRFPGGRKLSMQFIDSGEPNVGCAPIARAAGLQTANSIKAFAAIGDSSNEDGNAVYASTVTANGTIDIAPGGSFQLLRDFTRRWPYAWSVNPPADTEYKELGWFIAKRVKSTHYVANGASSARKWGMLFFDNSVGHAVEAAANKALKADGISAKAFFLSTDPAQQSQEATSLTAQIKSDGINSLVYGLDDAPADITIAKAFNSQQFYPDYYVTDQSVVFQLAVFGSLLFPTQIDRMHGVGVPDIAGARIDVYPNGANGASAALQGNSWRTASTTAYQQAGGKSANPQNGANLQGLWYALNTLALGIENAGKTLNAFTFAEGLQNANACELQRGFGEYQPQSSQPYFSSAQPWLLHGWTTYYWSSAFQSTYGKATGGYFQSYDGYHRFSDSYERNFPKNPLYNTGKHNGNYPYHPEKSGKYTPTMKCPAVKPAA